MSLPGVPLRPLPPGHRPVLPALPPQPRRPPLPPPPRHPEPAPQRRSTPPAPPLLLRLRGPSWSRASSSLPLRPLPRPRTAASFGSPTVPRAPSCSSRRWAGTTRHASSWRGECERPRVLASSAPSAEPPLTHPCLLVHLPSLAATWTSLSSPLPPWPRGTRVALRDRGRHSHRRYRSLPPWCRPPCAPPTPWKTVLAGRRLPRPPPGPVVRSCGHRKPCWYCTSSFVASPTQSHSAEVLRYRRSLLYATRDHRAARGTLPAPVHKKDPFPSNLLF